MRVFSGCESAPFHLVIQRLRAYVPENLLRTNPAPEFGWDFDQEFTGNRMEIILE